MTSKTKEYVSVLEAIIGQYDAELKRLPNLERAGDISDRDSQMRESEIGKKIQEINKRKEFAINRFMQFAPSGPSQGAQ